MDKKVIIECLLAIGIYVVSLLFWFFVFWVKKRIKWYRAKRRGLRAYPIGSRWRLTTAVGDVIYRVGSVWASRYKYEDAYCVRLELEGEEDHKRLVEGDPEFKELKRIDTESSQKLN